MVGYCDPINPLLALANDSVKIVFHIAKAQWIAGCATSPPSESSAETSPTTSQGGPRSTPSQRRPPPLLRRASSRAHSTRSSLSSTGTQSLNTKRTYWRLCCRCRYPFRHSEKGKEGDHDTDQSGHAPHPGRLAHRGAPILRAPRADAAPGAKLPQLVLLGLRGQQVRVPTGGSRLPLDRQQVRGNLPSSHGKLHQGHRLLLLGGRAQDYGGTHHPRPQVQFKLYHSPANLGGYR